VVEDIQQSRNRSLLGTEKDIGPGAVVESECNEFVLRESRQGEQNQQDKKSYSFPEEHPITGGDSTTSSIIGERSCRGEITFVDVPRGGWEEIFAGRAFVAGRVRMIFSLSWRFQ
jgi:hypothetical protein